MEPEVEQIGDLLAAGLAAGGRPLVPRTLRLIGMAMIGRFCSDVDLAYRERERTPQSVNLREWLTWLRANDHGWPYSFVNCALYVQRDPSALRRDLLRRVVCDGEGHQRYLRTRRYGSAA